MKLHKLICISALSLCMFSSLLTACGSNNDTGSNTNVEVTATDSANSASGDAASSEDVADDTADSSATSDADSAPSHGARDNTPIVLVPEASGTETYGNDTAKIDVSNASSGYFIIDYEGSNDKPKMQVIGPQGLTYNYDLHKGAETYNFTQGNGAYQIGIYEHLGNSQYTALTNASINVEITNEFSPYLYPTQYVYFDKASNVVKLAEELALSADNDLDVVANVYNYIISNISYDRELAQNVTSTYLPNPDKTIELKTGICFDYAALMTAMLRSQRIPCRLEVGYSGDAYHAWISTYIEDIGWVNGIVEFHGDNWELMDPTLAASTSERELRSYIGDGSNYTVCYEY